MKNHIKHIAASAVCACLTLSTPASATPFSLSAASITPGSGYGLESADPTDTTLDVLFSTAAFSAQNFVLNAVGEFATFNFGTVVFQEPNGTPGIQPGELDGLGVTANFTFLNPLGANQTVSASGTAILGHVNDQEVDYTLMWTPSIVSFGTTGAFSVTLNNLAFTGMESQALNATITLLALDSPVPVTPVPEPAPLALLGLGGLAIAFLRRRKQRYLGNTCAALV
jgi:hypothetical protein